MTIILGGTQSIDTFDAKYATLTDKYKLVSTKQLVAEVESHGFNVVKFVANKVRNRSKLGYQKHQVIFESPRMKSNSDGMPQLLLTNSHDGTSSVILRLGFFRLVCANGLVVGDDICVPFKIRHIGSGVENKIKEAIDYIVAQSDTLIARVEKMKSIKLTNEQIATFQRQALKLRTEVVNDHLVMPVHRNEDRNNDLFTVLNVVQENLIRGGAEYYDVEKRKFKRLRKITSISTQNEINTALWSMAEQLVA